MNAREMLDIRLRSQLVEGARAKTPLDVASHLLAIQAQDYAAATWAIGLRAPDSTLAEVERAIADRRIVRTWPMRGTLHFLAAEDVRWMLSLLPQRAVARAASRERQLELDPATLSRSRDLLRNELAGGRLLTRPALMALLDANGIATVGQRGYHIVARLAQEGLLVLGPLAGRQQTFALLDEWLPVPAGARSEPQPRAEALAKLAARYVRGHGPVSVDDLARWADLPKREASGALDSIANTLESTVHDGTRYWFMETARPQGPATGEDEGCHLLPAFDEYMIAYSERGLQLGEYLEQYGARIGRNGMLSPTIVIRGEAVGVWKRSRRGESVDVAVELFRELSSRERDCIGAAATRYGRFLGLAASVQWK